MQKSVIRRLLREDKQDILNRWRNNPEFLEVHSTRFLEGLATTTQYATFFRMCKWEDEMNAILATHVSKQAPIYVENWVDSTGKPKDFEVILL